MWFGYPSNLGFLLTLIQARSDIFHKTILNLVTDATGIQMFRSTGIEAALAMRVNFEPWSPAKLVEVAGNSDVCIIPSDLNSAKSAASSNRLITALALGLPTAAEVLPSYSEFKRYFADIRTDEFSDVVREPALLHDRIVEAQTSVVTAFNTQAMSDEWVRIFRLYDA